MFEDRTMLDPEAQPPGGDPNQTQVAPYAPAPAVPAFGGAEATQQAMSITCAVCQTPSPPGERWCRDCGFMLGSVPMDPGELPDPATQPRLVATANGGHEFVLNPGPNSVGRENADVLLFDSQVSRQHARLTLEGTSLTLEDLGSTNGSKVAGRRLGPGERAQVYDGDELMFGGIALRAIIPGGEQRPPQAAPAAAPAPPVDRGPAVATLARETGEELPLFAGANSIGRRPENVVCLTGDPYVSGQHAEIRCEGGAFVLVDLGSTNGTFIEGERLPAGDPRPIDESTAFQLGKTKLSLRLVSAPAQEEGEEPLAPAEPTVVLSREGETPAVEPPARAADEPGEEQP